LSDAPHAVPHAAGFSSGLSPAPHAAGFSSGLSPAPHAVPHAALVCVSAFLLHPKRFNNDISCYLLIFFMDVVLVAGL
jgi:hypothetical protein